MKLLMLIIFLSSCGKFQMPGYQDYGDSDGDQVLNKDETNFERMKIAAVIPMEYVEARMDFYEGLSNIKRHSLMLSNNLDLNQYSKDLLVKSEHHLRVNDYFTEFTSLQLKEVADIHLEEQTKFPVLLSFSSIKSEPKQVYYLKGDEKILLGDWKSVLNISLTRQQLFAVLNKQAQLSFSYLEDQTPYSDQSRAESIKEKTYRIFFNNGKTTTTYYVSKELKLEEILRLFKVPSYRLIQDQNLLTTQVEESYPEWWVRLINDREIVIIFEDLKNLSAHYLKGFKKSSQKLMRVNGFAANEMVLPKDPKSKSLLIISGLIKKVDFVEKPKIIISHNAPYGMKTCKQRSLEPTAETAFPLSLPFLEKNLVLKSAGGSQAEQVIIREHMGEHGPFWEIQIPEGIDKIQLGLKNIDSREYIATGPYASTCERPKPKPVLRTHESQIDLTIEAFIENIQ